MKKYRLIFCLIGLIMLSVSSFLSVCADETTTSQVLETSVEQVTEQSSTESVPVSTEILSTEVITSSEITTEASTTPATTEEELEAETESASGSVPIYRLYNPGLGKHLYTTDANEKKVLYEQHGWGYEGVGWYAPKSGKAVYRLYNPILKNHLYTTDTNEVKVLTSRQGWQSDNQGKAVFYSGGKISIYRLYNPVSARHHWTTDTNEYKVLPSHGWSQEGVKFSAVQIGKPMQTQYYGIFPKSSLTYVDDVTLAYERLIMEYQGRFHSANYSQVPATNINAIFLRYLEEVDYSYVDLDKNGVKELILRRPNSQQHDIYTYSGGQLIYLTRYLNHYEGGVNTVTTDGTLHVTNWPGPGVPFQHFYYKVSGNSLVKVGNSIRGKIPITNKLSWIKVQSFRVAGYRKVNLGGYSWASGEDAIRFLDNYFIKEHGSPPGGALATESSNGRTVTLRLRGASFGGYYRYSLEKYPTYVIIRFYGGVSGGLMMTIKVSRSDFSVIP